MTYQRAPVLIIRMGHRRDAWGYRHADHDVGLTATGTIPATGAMRGGMTAAHAMTVAGVTAAGITTAGTAARRESYRCLMLSRFYSLAWDPCCCSGGVNAKPDDRPSTDHS